MGRRLLASSTILTFELSSTHFAQFEDQACSQESRVRGGGEREEERSGSGKEGRRRRGGREEGRKGGGEKEGRRGEEELRTGLGGYLHDELEKCAKCLS